MLPALRARMIMKTRRTTASIRPAGWIFSALGAASLAYLAWSLTGRRYDEPVVPREIRLREVGVDAGRGNLLGVQPEMAPGDYASAERFYARLDGYFASAAGLLTPRTVVVLPEYLGTWLLFAGEKRGVYRAASLEGAMGLAFASNLPALTWPLLRSREPQRVAAALIRLKAARAAWIYDDVLSTLARQYGVAIVGGSIVLPSPEVIDGRLRAGQGPLCNASPFYRPDGNADPRVVRKACLTEEELPLLAPGACADLPVFDTPAGRLGVLICADAWFPAPYAQLRAQGVEFIAVPTYSYHDPHEPWSGYSGAPAPADVDLSDVGTISRAEAWRKYALAGRLAASGARAGLSVALFGALWGMQTRGEAAVVHDGRQVFVPAEEGVGLVNLWL